MRPRFSLKQRIALTYILLAVIVAGAFSLVSYISVAIIEEQIINARLTQLEGRMIDFQQSGQLPDMSPDMRMLVVQLPTFGERSDRPVDAGWAQIREEERRAVAADGNAALVPTLDPNHLVSLGHEGTQGANGSEDIVRRAHRDIDYLTAHIWPLNWGWVDGKDLAGTWDAGSAKVRDYLAAHERLATELGKPLLFEEFGFPRDGEVYAPGTATTVRERYYRQIYAAVEGSWASGGPVMGSNFWAWNGEARAAHPDARFRDGDLAYMGDPPHEPQGWYGLFDGDASTLALVRAHAAKRCLGLAEPCLAA